MLKPVRIQRLRIRGYNMEAESRAVNGLPCISVTRPGRWGNPYSLKSFSRALSLELFGNTVRGVWDPSVMNGHSERVYDLTYAAHHRFLSRLREPLLEMIERELGGRNLACFCSLSDDCHADTYLGMLSKACPP
jgi:hypothetical protein